MTAGTRVNASDLQGPGGGHARPCARGQGKGRLLTRRGTPRSPRGPRLLPTFPGHRPGPQSPHLTQRQPRSRPRSTVPGGRRPRVPVCICASLPVPRDPDPRPAPRRLRFTVPSSTREPHHESPAPRWRLRPASKAVLAPRPVEMPDRKSRLSHPPLPGMSRWFCIARRPVAAE